MITIRNNVSRYEVGIDAVTLIFSGQEDRMRVYQELQDVWGALRQEGNRIRSFRVHSYVGHSCGPLRIASDDEGTLVQCTGGLSQTVATIAAQYDCRATRIDLQSTFQLVKVNPALAALLYRRLEGQREKGEHTRIQKFVSSSTGDTVYTGSRKGNRTIRVYDKSDWMNAERGAFWRYEVEFHGQKANAIWASYRQAKDDKEWIEGWLYKTFDSIGVDIPVTQGDTGSAMATPGNLRSTDRYLDWFRVSVAPVVRDLTNKVDAAILLEALGIQRTLLNSDYYKEDQNGLG
jgi:hypothetical protein